MVIVETNVPVVLMVQEEEAALTDVAVERSIDRHRHRPVPVTSHQHRKELANCLHGGRAVIPYIDMGHNLRSSLPAGP